MGLNERQKTAYNAVKSSRIGIDIVEASQRNIERLALLQLSNLENQFVAKFNSLEFALEHRSSAEENAGWHRIKGGTKEHGGTKNRNAKLLSLFELAKLMAEKRGLTSIDGKPLDSLSVDKVSFATVKELLGSEVSARINTSDRDYANFGNIDYIFFKLHVKGTMNFGEGHAGVAGGKPKAFTTNQLFEVGWVSLDDWVSFSAHQKFTNDLNTVWYGFPQNGLEVQYRDPYTKEYKYKAYKEIGSRFSHGWKNDPENMQSKTLTKCARDEVFFGPDIKQGLALTLVEHLRAANPNEAWLKKAVGGAFPTEVSKLASGIWKLIEAKVPGSMSYYEFKMKKKEAAGVK